MMEGQASGKELVVRINGQDYSVPPELANAPLASFIKTRTPFKSVKVACGEGGCGACTVADVEERDGRPYLRTFNSCLAPVYSVRGRSLLTAEGLPAAAAAGGGTSLVADRLASFHASQCGYCTPGFTVAAHAALHNAAATAAASPSGHHSHHHRGEHASCGGGGCDGNGGCSRSAGGDRGANASGGCGGGLLAGEELRRALEGNLCRCTGYRPIVAACRSLAEEVVDMEDLLGPAAAGPAPAAAPPPPAAGLPLEEVPLGPG
ncbi:hypothetical protein Agub_g7709, partial [Astrephomene gubernaculifera]